MAPDDLVTVWERDLGLGLEQEWQGETRPLVTVLVPVFNEGAHLERSLGSLYQHLKGLDDSYEWELLVVDDGSTDKTPELLASLSERLSRLRVVSHRHNRGLGRALRSGFETARGDYIVTCDADLSYHPSHIDRLLATIIDSGAKVVVASPYMEGGAVVGVPRLRGLLSRWANRLLKAVSNSHTSTITGMVRAYDRLFVSALSLKAVDNQINAEIIYKTDMMREQIIEIPARLEWSRDEEDTKARRAHLSLLRTTIDFAFSGFIFRPFLFFILPGFLLLLVSLYALGWAGYHVIRFIPRHTGNLDSVVSGAVADAFSLSPQSFVIGGLAAIFSVQLIGLGIMAAQSKRYFEELYHLQTRLFQADRWS